MMTGQSPAAAVEDGDMSEMPRKFGKLDDGGGLIHYHCWCYFFGHYYCSE